MPERIARAIWNGDLKNGDGQLELGSGAFKGDYSFSSRFESGAGTNPEELIAAAHAGCFSMALASGLAQAGYNPEFVNTTAKVNLSKIEKGFKITSISLKTEARVPDIDEKIFLEQAEAAKENCPVSQVLTETEISLQASLVEQSELVK